MCKVMEEYAKEYAKEYAEEKVIETAVYCGLEKEEIVELLCKKFEYTVEEAEKAYQEFLKTNE